MGEKFGEFDMYTWDWQEYCKWLKTYFESNKTAEDLKVTNLISAVGNTTSKLIGKLCSPSKPADMTYDKIVQIVEDHFKSKPFVKEERYKFRRMRQREKTIVRYADALRKKARFCDFGEREDENLQEQFSSGLRSDTIRQKLNCIEESLTFDKLVSMAKALEAVEKKAAENKKGEKKTEKNISLKESAAEIESTQNIAENKTSSKEEENNFAVNNAVENNAAENNAVRKNAPANDVTEKSAAYKTPTKKRETAMNSVEIKVAANQKQNEAKRNEAENNAADYNTVKNNTTENNMVRAMSAIFKNSAKNKETAMNAVENNVTEKGLTEKEAVEKNEAENNTSDGDCVDKRTAASRGGPGGSSYQRSGESSVKLRDYHRRGSGPDRRDGGGKYRHHIKREFKETEGQKSGTPEIEQNIEMEDGEIHPIMENPQHSRKRSRREDLQLETAHNETTHTMFAWQANTGFEIPTHLSKWLDRVTKYNSEGRLEMAVGACKQKLVDLEDEIKFGRDDPDIATVLNILASIYREQRRYEEAFGLLDRALRILKTEFGESHPSVVATYNNLAELHETQGKSRDVGKPSTSKN